MKDLIFKNQKGKRNSLTREQMKNVLGGNGYGFVGCSYWGTPFHCYVTAGGSQTYDGITCANSLEEAVALNAPNFPAPYYSNLYCTY